MDKFVTRPLRMTEDVKKNRRKIVAEAVSRAQLVFKTKKIYAYQKLNNDAQLLSLAFSDEPGALLAETVRKQWPDVENVFWAVHWQSPKWAMVHLRANTVVKEALNLSEDDLREYLSGVGEENLVVIAPGLSADDISKGICHPDAPETEAELFAALNDIQPVKLQSFKFLLKNPVRKWMFFIGITASLLSAVFLSDHKPEIQTSEIIKRLTPNEVAALSARKALKGPEPTQVLSLLSARAKAAAGLPGWRFVGLNYAEGKLSVEMHSDLAHWKPLLSYTRQHGFKLTVLDQHRAEFEEELELYPRKLPMQLVVSKDDVLVLVEKLEAAGLSVNLGIPESSWTKRWRMDIQVQEQSRALEVLAMLLNDKSLSLESVKIQHVDGRFTGSVKLNYWILKI